MIPQKFLMMKCIRILFLLHVVGILFFAFKLYSNSVSQGGTSTVSSHVAVALTSGKNLSSVADVRGEDDDEINDEDDSEKAVKANANYAKQNVKAINKYVKQDVKAKTNYAKEDVKVEVDNAEEDEVDNAEEDDVDDDYGEEDEDDEYEVVTTGEADEDETIQYDDVKSKVKKEPEYDESVDTKESTDAYDEEEIQDEDEEYEEDYLDEQKREKNTAMNADNSARNTRTGNPSLSYQSVQGQPVAISEAVLKNSHWTLASAGKYSKLLYSPPLNERPIQRYPQALVIGSPNSGIRPLLDFLEIHPQLISVKRDIAFFDSQKRLQLYTNDFLAQMPFSYSNQVTILRTHLSHWTKKSVCELYSHSKSMKVIAVLRDPVSRIISQATTSRIGKTGQLVVAQQGEILRINNLTEPIVLGQYVEYLKMWTQCFPKSQILVIEWSDIMQRPSETVRGIESYLGVPHKVREDNFRRDLEMRVYCIQPFHVKETMCLSKKRNRSPTLSPAEQAMMYRFYSKHNEELFKLLGQRYDWGPVQA